jgi:DNA sulfur modification protein DndC
MRTKVKKPLIPDYEGLQGFFIYKNNNERRAQENGEYRFVLGKKMMSEEKYLFQENETRIAVEGGIKKHNNSTRKIWSFLLRQGWDFYGVVRDWTAVFRKESYFLVLHHFIREKPLKDMMGTPNHSISWLDLFYPEHIPIAGLLDELENVLKADLTIPMQAFTDAFYQEKKYELVDWHLQSPKYKFQVWAEHQDFTILVEVFFNMPIPPYGVAEKMDWPDLSLEPEYGELFDVNEYVTEQVERKTISSGYGEFMGIDEHVNPSILLSAKQAIDKIFTEAKRVIQAYSGGKDSSVCLQLCVDYLLEHPEHQDKFFIVSADTGVENPIISKHILSMKNVVVKTLNERFVNGFSEDRFIIVQPSLDDNYVTCVFGKGYTPPSMQNKWCVDRLKIRPAMTELMKFTSGEEMILTELASETSGVTLILGVRSSESISRAASVDHHFGDNFYGEHAIKSIRTAAPIVNWTATDVATYLVREKPPWSEEYSNFNLINIYGSAAGTMECPIGAMIANENDAVKSCSGSGARFGCFSCTVVKEDTSMKNLVESYEELAPYYKIRTLLKATQDIRYGGRTGYQRKRGFGTFGSGFGDLTIDMRTILLELWYRLGLSMKEEEVLMIDRLVKEREITEGNAVTHRFRTALYRLLPVNPVFVGSMYSNIWEPKTLIDPNGEVIEQRTCGVDRCTQEDLVWIARYHNIVQKVSTIDVGDYVKINLQGEWIIEAMVESKPSRENVLILSEAIVLRNIKNSTANLPKLDGSVTVSIPYIHAIEKVEYQTSMIFMEEPF